MLLMQNNCARQIERDVEDVHRRRSYQLLQGALGSESALERYRMLRETGQTCAVAAALALMTSIARLVGIGVDHDKRLPHDGDDSPWQDACAWALS